MKSAIKKVFRLQGKKQHINIILKSLY